MTRTQGQPGSGKRCERWYGNCKPGVPAMRRGLAVTALVLVSAPVQANRTEDARSIILAATEVAGGETWLSPATLVLEGRADFYAPDRPGVVRRVDDYRMWRVLDPDRVVAHGPDGKVRITARQNGKVLFDVGFDGAVTWNERGPVPQAEADAYWAANFGFGIIRSALKQGFRLERAPDRTLDGHALDMVRIVDPAGQTTLFGIDRKSRYIRYMGFATPRGWHERVYDDFVRYHRPRWLQARSVTLFYNGVRQNTVYWRRARVGEAIDPSVFAMPAEYGAKP